jgi:hypothetical protein
MVEQKAVKWSFARKWMWRNKAVRRWGLRGLLLPIDIAKDARGVSLALEVIFASVCPLFTLTEKLPYIQRLHELALDVVQPRLWGYDFTPPAVTIDEVIFAAVDLLDYTERLKEKDDVAAEVLLDLAYTYTGTVYYAIDELANLENNAMLFDVAMVLYYLRWAIIRRERKYIARAAEEAINTGIAANPERLKTLLGAG